MSRSFILGCLFIIGIFFFSDRACSQSLPYLKHNYFRFPPGVKPGDYYPGIVQLKLKPQYKLAFSGALRMDAKTMKFLEPMGIRKVRPAVPQGLINRAMARTAKPLEHDLSLYQVINFDPSVPVNEAINLLYNTGMVDLAEPVYVYHSFSTPNDPYLSRQYYLSMINAIQAWDITTGDSTLVIGIPDSGVDIDHPDLVDNLFINKNDPVNGIDDDHNGYIDDWRGWDFAGASASNPNDEDNDPSIPKGGDFTHGTGVGGIIGSRGNNSIGVAGLAWKCKLLFTKHFADDQPDTSSSYAVSPFEGVLYCAMMGASVINCSWGGPYPNQIYQDYIDVITQDMGVLIVASAGNSGNEVAEYPASYNHVLSVGSVEKNYLKSYYSSYGPNVDLVAPGTGIWVDQYNDIYASNSGTSYSAPMVSGAAVLVKSKYPSFTGNQIGELLRVTANDTIYTTNSSAYKNKLGTGLLDIKKALTSRPPGIRLLNFKLANSQGHEPKPGESAQLTADFINYLWPSSGGLEVRLSTSSSLVTITKNTSQLGIINMGQTATNSGDPFTLTLNNTIPDNTQINFLFEFTDGQYHDYQYASILLNPTFLNIEENKISTSVAENGRIAYQDTAQQEGLGLAYDGNKILFEMGLMLGTSDSSISDCVRSVNYNYDNDFTAEQRISEISPGNYSQSEIYGNFNDTKAGKSSSHVLVSYRTMVWKGDPDNNYFIIQYDIKNNGSSALKNFYGGLYADWDISNMGGNDRANWDSLYRVGYIYSLDTARPFYGGIQVLTGNPNYYAIENDNTLPGNAWGVYDGFTDAEKFQSLSSGLKKITAGYELGSGTDVSHTVASGPYTVKPGDSVILAFAIHAAKDLPELLASAAAADTMYNYTLRAQVPVPSNDTVCWNSNALLTASGANRFNWYTDKSGGNPVYSGDSLAINNMNNDSIFYVSNADNSWESIRIPAYVIVKASPDITVSGSTVLCSNDTVTLIAGPADQYLWNPGGQTTRNIYVTDSGTYSLQVRDNRLNCISHSPEIHITKNESPVADFSTSIQDIIGNRSTLVNFTDKSTLAASWFWQLSDGQTSMVENPSFTLNASSDITITLTVDAANGCQAKKSMVITVTGLQENPEKKFLVIYPNPGDKILKIKLTDSYQGPVSVSLINSSGFLMYKETFLKNSYDFIPELNLSTVPPGMYVLRIGLGNNTLYSEKYIKKQ